MKTKHTDQVKRSAVESVQNGESYTTVAKKLRVTPNAIRIWKHKYAGATNTVDGRTTRSTASTTEIALRQENLRLKAVIGELYLSSRQ